MERTRVASCPPSKKITSIPWESNAIRGEVGECKINRTKNDQNPKRMKTKNDYSYRRSRFLAVGLTTVYKVCVLKICLKNYRHVRNAE